LGTHLKATGQSFNFAAIKATLLNTALNAGIFLAVTVAVQALYKVFDNYIHRVERARERTDKLFDEFKQMNDTLADHRKTVSELADRYDELSKGVNKSDNKPFSLSTEEYEEFLDINEQLADSFPGLVKGIDENGNSILSLGENGTTAREQLEGLLQTEEDLNNFRIAQDIGDAFAGVYTYVEEANEATEKLNGTINASNEAMSKLQDVAENGITLTGDNGQFIFGGNMHNEAELNYMNALTASVNEFWKTLDSERRVELAGIGIDNSTLFRNNLNPDTGVFEIYADTYNLTAQEITTLEKIIQDNVDVASGALLDSISDQSQELQNQIQQGKNAWTDFIPSLVATMKSKTTFTKLDPGLQDIAVKIVEGLDYSYASAMQEWNPTDPYAYVRDKIIGPMSDSVSKLSVSAQKKLQSDIEDLFSIDTTDMPVDDIVSQINSYIDSIATAIGENPEKLEIRLGFDYVDDLKAQYQHAVDFAKDKFDGYDPTAFFKEHSINTQEEIDAWQKIAQAARDAAEAERKYLNQNTGNSSSPSFTAFTEEQSKSIDDFQSKVKTLGDTLSSLQSGDTVGLTDLIQEFPELAGQTDNLEQAIQQLIYNSLQKLYDTLGQGLPTNIKDDLQSIADEASGAIPALNTAFSAIQDSYKALDEFKNAMNSNGLTDSILSSVGSLSGALNDMVAGFYAGIVSADELYQALTQHYQIDLQNYGNALIIKNQYNEEFANAVGMNSAELTNSLMNDYGVDLTNCKTYNAKKLEIERQTLQTLGNWWSKYYNAQTQTFTADMEQLASQVETVPGAAELYYRIKGQANRYEGALKELNSITYEGIGATFNGISSKFSNQNSSSSSGSGSKSAKEATNETIDWIGKKIEFVDKKIETLKKKSEDIIGWHVKNQLQDTVYDQLESKITLLTNAHERYMEEANKIGLSDEYKQLIESGKIDIEVISDETLKKQISDYEKWYTEAQNVKEELDNVKSEQAEIAGIKLDNITDDYDRIVEKLQDTSESAIGWQNQNALQDKALGSLREQLALVNNEYQKQIQLMDQVALSDVYKEMIKNGTLDLNLITDDNIMNLVLQYSQLLKNARDCEDAIKDTNDKIREAEELKLDNIINDYETVVSLLEKYTNYRQKLIDLQQKQGVYIPEQTDYQDLINDQIGIYHELEKEYKTLKNALSDSDIEKGSEKWNEMREQLVKIKTDMLDCADAVEDFKDEIISMRFKPFDDLIAKLEAFESETSDILTLLGSDGLTKDGMLTDKGLSVVGLYGQQYITAKKQAAEYSNAIMALEASLANGDITQDEYNDKIYEYQSAQRQAALATKDAMDAMIDLREQAIEEEIDAMNELIDAKKKALEAEEELYEYQKKISGYNNTISTLEKQISVLSLATDNASKAKRLQLEEELAEARQELADYQHDYAVDAQKDALDEQADAYETAKKQEIDELRTNLNKQQTLLENYLGQVKDNYSTVYSTLTEYSDAYNMEVTEDLLNPFSSATEASLSFSQAFADMVSEINYNLEQIDWSTFENLASINDVVNDINNLSNGSSASFQSAGGGEWHKNNTGWWYGKSEDDYVSDGIYTINGKQYGFNKDGYMKTDWHKIDGDWYYFEPENGQMVKSTWRQSKNGDWYYLQNDGTMATDAAVKAKSGGGYYYVDDSGAWDGITLTKDEIDELGYRIAYKKGTQNAMRGRALMDEEGIGSELIVTKQGILKQFEGGEHVFDKASTDTLWKLAQVAQASPSKTYISDIVKNAPMKGNKSIVINSPLMQIDGTGLSQSEIVSIINNEVKRLPDRLADTIRRSIM